jgi:PAS domain-containing protein
MATDIIIAPRITAHHRASSRIIGHRRTVGELRKSEERHRALIVATTQVVWITNAGG